MAPQAGSKRTATTVDEYLASLSPDKRDALERLRRIIRTSVPRAEECISYQIPAFRLDGRVLVWFAAASKHCSFFPGAIVQAHKHELEGYETSKGTIRFRPDKPLPATLVRKLLKDCVARNELRAAKRSRAR